MVGLKPKDATAEVFFEKIPRGKMSLEHLNKTFRCNADFIQDQFGGNTHYIILNVKMLMLLFLQVSFGQKIG